MNAKKEINFDTLLTQARKNPGRVVVTCANNEEALEATSLGVREGIISGGWLLGNAAEIQRVAREVDFSLEHFEIIGTADDVEAAQKSARMLAHGQGDFLLKGQVDTKVYMKAILDKELALVPQGSTLSHVAVMDIPSYHKLLITSDAAITIEPPVDDKIKLTQNAINFARALGIVKPKVAMVAAVEKVNQKMLSTVHAQEVVNAARAGKITGGIVEGPYDIYIATSHESAAVKGVKGEVCGEADVLIFSDINSANVFYKSIQRFVPGAKTAGLIAGARFPILLPSRADAAETKLCSLIVAAFLKHK